MFMFILLFGSSLTLYFYTYLYDVFLTYHILFSIIFLVILIFLVFRAFVIFKILLKITILSLILVYSFWNVNFLLHKYINTDIFSFFSVKFNLYSSCILNSCLDLL